MILIQMLMVTLQDVSTSPTALTIGYHLIIQASLEVNEAELSSARKDKLFRMKLSRNPLKHVILSLADLLETDSQEARELDTEKRRQIATVLSGPVSDSFAEQPVSSPVKPVYTDSNFPTSYETPSNKRKVSETSFGTRSTESTPNKLVHSEAKVQALQNMFVHTIINEVWLGSIDIPWAKGRHMFLTYAECVFLEMQLIVERSGHLFNIHCVPRQTRLSSAASKQLQTVRSS
jgi:hypothetical protein